MERQMNSPALVMRVIKIAFIVSGFLYAYIAVKLPVPGGRSVSPAFELAITVVALACIVIGFNTRRFFFRRPPRTSENSLQSTLLKRWMVANIMSLAYFEACILFGMVLHFLGAHGWLVGMLFGIGIGSMVFWSPGAPPTTEEGGSSQG